MRFYCGRFPARRARFTPCAWLDKLTASGHSVDVVASEPACVSFAAETDLKLVRQPLRRFRSLVPAERAHLLTAHGPRDIGASIASGSVRHDGMIVVPCSMGSLARIAGGFFRWF